MANINYTTMQIRLEFLFRMLNQLNLAANVEGFAANSKLTPADFEDVCNIVATIGLNIVWINRNDDSIVLSREESINARGMSQVIADEFMKLSDKIKVSLDQVLPHMRTGRYEMEIRTGMEDIIAKIKTLVEPVPN